MAAGEVMREEDRWFVAPNGLKIAKAGLSPEAVERYRGMACGGAVKRMAEGGKVEEPRVATLRYRVVAEDPDVFRVEDDRGAFTVAKKGLSEALLKRIRSALPGFAAGGQVGEELGIDLTAPAAAAGMGDIQAADAFSRAMTLPAPAPIDITLPPAAVGMAAAPASAPIDVTVPPAPAGLAAPPLPERSASDLPPSLASKWRAASMREAQSPPVVKSPLPAPAPAVVPTVQRPRVTAPAGGDGGTATALADWETGRIAQETGIRAAAAAAQKEGDATAKIMEGLNAHREEAKRAYEAQLGRLQAQGDALYQSIQGAKIDPKRLWGEASTGSKIGAAIGMILGGVGAGLTKGPNPALQVITNAIDRDVDAQKANLGKQENLLQHNFRQTQDLRSAYALTRADLMDAAAAQLDVAKAALAGEKARAFADQQVGQLRGQAAQARQQIAAQGLQAQNAALDIWAKRQLVPLQVEATMTGLQQAAEQRALRQQVLGDPAASQAARLRAAGVKEELIIERPGGRAFMGKSNESAQKARETLTSIDQARAGIGDLRDMMATPFRSLSLEQRARAQVATQALAGLLRLPLTGPGALTDSERKMLIGVIGNPAAFWSLDSSTKAKFDQLSKTLENAEAAILGNSVADGGQFGALSPARR